jgi:hypothetical protein
MKGASEGMIMISQGAPEAPSAMNSIADGCVRVPVAVLRGAGQVCAGPGPV